MERTDIIKLKELINRGWEINEEEGTIKNPKTGRNIKISTALGYDKEHPAYKAALKAQGSEDTGSEDGGGEDSDTNKSDTSSDDSSEFTSIGNDKYKLKGQENDQSADVYTKDEIDLINKNPDVFNQYKPLGNGKYKHQAGFNSTKDEVIQRLSRLARDKSKYRGGTIRQRSGGERQQSSQNSKKMTLNKGTLKTGGQTRTEPGTYMNPDTREWFVVVKGGGYLGPYKSLGDAKDAQVKYSSLDYSQQQALRGESITYKLKKLQEALTQVQKYQMDEPDHEGEMAKSQMLKTMKYAADIMNMIDDSSNLPAWVQSKLTKIADYIGAVKHYMDSKTVRHVVTNMGEGVERKSEEIRLVDMVPLNSKNKSVNEARTVSKPIKVDDETMVQIVGDNKGFRELTATLNPKTGKPIQKFGYDRGNEIADSKEELIKKLQKKYGKSIKFESVNEKKDNFMNESYVSWDTSLSSLMKDTNNLRSYVNDIKDAKAKRNSLTKVKTILKHLQTVEKLFSEIDKDIDDDEFSRGSFR